MVGQHPLVNILRGAMAILAAVVQHPPAEEQGGNEQFGFTALKPALETYPEFLEALVERLSSADHSLCLNALQLINALMRDAMSKESDTEWPKFIKRLQDLGVIKAIHLLMQDAAIQDLASSLLDFQGLTKILLKKWRAVPVDLGKAEHRRALKTVFITAYPERRHKNDQEEPDAKKMHDPEKWRRLGFESESPAWEFEDVGFLGMMDLTDFARKTDDGFQRLIQEQATKSQESRCPIAKVSLAVSSVLYDHFEIDDADIEDQNSYGALDSRNNLDKAFRPLLLQWSRIHTSGVRAFMRLWSTTGAKTGDFSKIEELIRILIEEVVGLSPRTRDVAEVEIMLAAYDLKSLRDLQTKLLEVTHEESWGQHLRQVKDELRHEASQFVKEQRIRVLLKGTWFPSSVKRDDDSIDADEAVSKTPWRFIRLSYNRRYLHYDDFDTKTTKGKVPSLDSLEYKIDLSSVSSVVSNVTTAPRQPSEVTGSTDTLKSPTTPATNTASSGRATTDIVIHGYAPSSSDGHDIQRQKTHRRNQSSRSTAKPEPAKVKTPLLTLHPSSQTSASEWLDGLLMLLNQSPITSETNKLVDFIANYGLKIRLLNVRFDDPANLGGAGYDKEIELPSREGLDEDYFYNIGGA